MREIAILDLILIGWFALLAGIEFVEARRRAIVEAGNDARLITNFGLGALGLATNSMLPIAKIGSSVLAQSLGGGLATLFEWPWLLALGVFLLADSLAAYWTHRAMHALPWLWRIHRVHHADNAVDVSTSLRNHPLELMVTIPVSALVVLIVGAPPSAILIAQTITVVAVIWQHADISLPRVERLLAPILITPSVHRIHHSPDRRRHDSNYGEVIIIWDRLFRTFTRSEGRGRVGLDGQVARPDRLLQQIWSPVYAA